MKNNYRQVCGCCECFVPHNGDLICLNDYHIVVDDYNETCSYFEVTGLILFDQFNH